MTKDNPYLSVVLVGRNDNYGGDFKSRLQNCITSLNEQLNRLRVYSEIIFVNYNFLSDPEIIQFIEWPKSTENVQIRIIDVPSELHQKFVSKNNVKDVPVIEYLAKNIGIRRSNGEFILCMNPDILLTDKIVQYLAQKKLKKNFFYRANRIDFEKINNKNKLICIHLKGTTFTISTYNLAVKKWLDFRSFFIKWYYKNTVHLERLFNFLRIPVIYDNAEYYYHCKVSGDFMLVSREAFIQTQSYYETAPIALHIDSLFVIQVASSGLKEYIFDSPIYHREHERRYSSERKNEIEDNAYKFFQSEAQQMLKVKKNKIYNFENWGLKDIELHEQIC